MSDVLKPSIIGGRRLRDVADAMRRAGRTDLQRMTRAAVKAEAKPTLDSLKQAARDVKITGERTAAARPFTGATTAKRLRARIANASAVEYRNSEAETRVSFVIKSAKLGSAEALPRKIDSGEPWRHPIMGHKSRWAVSKGEPFFFQPIKDHLPEFRQRINEVLDDIVKEIEAS